MVARRAFGSAAKRAAVLSTQFQVLPTDMSTPLTKPYICSSATFRSARGFKNFEFSLKVLAMGDNFGDYKFISRTSSQFWNKLSRVVAPYSDQFCKISKLWPISVDDRHKHFVGTSRYCEEKLCEKLFPAPPSAPPGGPCHHDGGTFPCPFGLKNFYNLKHFCDLSNFVSEIDILVINNRVNDCKFCVDLGLRISNLKFCKSDKFANFPFFQNFVKKKSDISNFAGFRL